MANLYNTLQEPDEISLFLQQILLRSSSSYSDHLPAPDPAQIPLPNVSSSNVGNSENEFDDCDYESEEVGEALVEETAARPTPSSRSSSKRSRAAEVHNLSEKRRRSRINEKMKALQNLIPNSNKTDKASMLDEAIEYLKQLQLQVQMLTMRNGLSLYPICLPGVVQPDQMNTNMSKAVCMDQSISAPVADFSRTIALKSSLEAQPSMHQLNFGSSKGLCKENSLLRRPLVRDRGQCSSGAFATSSIPCETQASNLKGNSHVEAYQGGGGGEHLLPNFVNSPIFSSQLNM